MPKAYTDEDKSIQEAEYAKRYDAVNYSEDDGGYENPNKDLKKLKSIIKKRSGGEAIIKQLEKEVDSKYKSQNTLRSVMKVGD